MREQDREIERGRECVIEDGLEVEIEIEINTGKVGEKG